MARTPEEQAKINENFAHWLMTVAEKIREGKLTVEGYHCKLTPEAFKATADFRPQPE